jgi:diguanylate cyclase (GGDEF)-like protein/PAS domain S-box-containing protein
MSVTKPGAKAAVLEESSYQQLFDEVGAFIYATDCEGRYTYANRMVLELLGQPLEAVVGHRFDEFVDLPEDDRRHEIDARVYRDGETVAQEETNLIQATGEVRHYWSLKKPLRDASGAVIGMLGISHDITETKRLEAKVREQNRFLDAILDHVEALVYMKDAQRRFVYANRPMARLFGRPVEDIIGRLDTDLLPREAADRFWAKDLEIFRSGRPYANEETLADASGQVRHYWSVMVPFEQPDGTPAVIGLSTDITELHELKEGLRRQTVTDDLTGVANRRAFYERAAREFARSIRHGLPLSLISTDLDHFKRINDDYGHRVGDRVLCDFATRVQKMLRSEDLCARTGGEEFCILLPDTDLASARALAERIRRVVADCHPDPEHPRLQFTASFGVASLGQGEHDFESLYLRADRALYRAKEAGRNRTCILPSD